MIHYQPIEWYPPVMNMLNFLGRKYNGEIEVFTHADYRNNQVYDHPDIEIRRFPFSNDYGFVRRMLSYIRFTLNVVIWLFRQKPENIFYYETNSALPVYLYFKLTRFRHSRLFIHYHEYNTEEQYREGMKLVHYSYKKERDFLWKNATWISHTNTFRLKFFQEDYPFLNNLSILPNYPPKDWSAEINPLTEITIPVKVVYVGSMGMDNFYLREFSEWVDEQGGKVIFDIYSHNYTPESNEYLQRLNSPYINLNDKGIGYDDLPEILKNYQVGLILYKGFNKNFTYNETNKLFEYLACGLDVWFSEETKGIYKHITQDTYPKVVKLDYNRLSDYSIDELIDHRGLAYKPSEYFCEEVYDGFLDKLIGE